MPRKAAGLTREEERFSPLLPAEDLASGRDYTIRAKVWRWKNGPWHFATLPIKQAAEIRRRFGASARGWGSIRVKVKIGDTEWPTSLFPERKAKSYLFAIKAEVRKAEDVKAGKRITAVIHIV